jgi:hypothetical protein
VATPDSADCPVCALPCKQSAQVLDAWRFRNAGETTVQVTVADSAGTVIGTVTMPVIVRPPDSSVGITSNTVIEPGA